MSSQARARAVLGGLFTAALLLLAVYVAGLTAVTTLASPDGVWILAVIASCSGGCLVVDSAARRFNRGRPACRRCGRRFGLARWTAIADDDGVFDYTPVHTCRRRWWRPARHART